MDDRDIHRIGGSSLENLRLKSRESTLNPPGISVLKASTPGEAARQIRAAFPRATSLSEAARTVGSASEDSIRAAGFDVIPAPTATLPGHYRLIHPGGTSGFNDADLARLASAFADTTGH